MTPAGNANRIAAVGSSDSHNAGRAPTRWTPVADRPGDHGGTRTSSPSAASSAAVEAGTPT